MSLEPYLTCADLAKILKVSSKTIQNRLLAKPESLPPRSKLPGIRGPRWAPRIVSEWQAKYDPVTADPTGKRRPGRPSKAEEIKKRMVQNGAPSSGIDGI